MKTKSNRTTAEVQAVAAEILRQIGGRQAAMCIGLNAASLSQSEEGDGVSFRIKGSKNCQMIQILLTPSDTYTVRFLKFRKLETTRDEKFSDIYNDGLMDLIERQTGLYLSLHARR